MSVRKIVRTMKNGKRTARFRSEVWVAGCRLASKCFETQAAAHAWHDREKARLGQDSFGRSGTSSATFADCLKQYEVEGVAHLIASSWQSRQPRMKYLREAPLAKLKMSAINASSIDRWFDWLIKEHGSSSRSRKSFAHELRLLTIVLNWWRNYKDDQFVVPIVKRHRQRVKFKALVPRRPDYFMRKEEVQLWLWHMREQVSPVYYRLALLQALTGIRVGEAAGLQWDEVDLSRRLFRITRVVWWDHATRLPQIRDGAKTAESVRTLIMPDAVMSMLREIGAEQGCVGLLFRGRNDGPLQFGSIVKAYNKAFRAAGLPYSGTRILRHTWASNALLATKDLSAVQYNLGHRDQKVTQNYAKVVALACNDAPLKTALYMGFLEDDRAQNRAR